MAAVMEPPPGPVIRYCDALRAEVFTAITTGRPKAYVHRTEWAKVLAGEPVEINPSIGTGFKVMTVQEYVSKWKRNDDLPDCLSCGSVNTREHHFSQSWCRGKRQWSAESLCMDCHAFSYRSYSDPDFLAPEEYEKHKWAVLTSDVDASKEDKRKLLAHTMPPMIKA